MIEINKDSLEGMILKNLLKDYPITSAELQEKLKVRRHVLKKSLDELARRGIVEHEMLPDKIFLRLSRRDIRFVGIKPCQKRGIVKKTDRGKTGEYEGMMFR